MEIEKIHLCLHSTLRETNCRLLGRNHNKPKMLLLHIQFQICPRIKTVEGQWP